MLISVVVFLSCEKESDNVIDPSYISPLISDLYKSKDSVLTTSFAPLIDLNVSVKVSANGGSDIQRVECKVNSPDGSFAGLFSMADNGVLPDSAAGDGRYSVNIKFNNISCLVVGQYTFSVYAYNKDELISNQINSAFFVINMQNLPPVITNTDLPDSVVRPVTGQFNLTIKVTVIDTNGACDINEVYFDAYRPNGAYIGRNWMTNAGNNIYSFTNFVGPSTSDSSYGYFRYLFQATDNSNAQSIVVADSIKFVRPNP
jgi:hypothetical protein